MEKNKFPEEKNKFPREKNKFPKLEIFKGDDIFYSEDIPINWVIENILPEGMTILASLPKIGKSFFALQISLAVENALEVLGFKVKEGRTLYCAYEDNKKKRLGVFSGVIVDIVNDADANL